MTPIEFLRAVWPNEGLYCIATPLAIKGYRHDVFETIEAAAKFVDTIIDEQNIFFATHTLKEARVWDPRHHRDRDAADRPWVGGWRVRTQVNSKACRIFFFDLDVEARNDEKKYADSESAVAGLRAFVTVCGLPRPMVVSSGGGLHVYWVLDTAVESDAWVLTAAKLKQLAHHHGLKIDDARTTDTASVLRVAGTFNHKGNKDVAGTHDLSVLPKRPVLVYKETTEVSAASFMALVDSAIDDAEIIVKKPRAIGKIGAASKLGVNTSPTFNGPQPSMRALIKACPKIARIAAVEGATSDEPELWNTLGSVKFVRDGRKHFHHISAGHRDYDSDTVDAKFDRWEAGPVSCEKMEDACGVTNAHLCHGCPFIKSAGFPIVAAGLVDRAPPPVVVTVVAGVETEVVICDPPLPWKRAREIGITLIAETKEGRAYEKKVYPYDLYPLERSTSHDRKTEAQQWRVHLPHNDTRDITIPASIFFDDRSLRSQLANHGVYTSNFEDLKAYMSAYIQELQRLNPATVQHNHLGWVENNSKFVFPTKVIQPDGGESAANLSVTAASAKDYMTQRGSIQKQAELMRFYQHRSYVAQQFFILASLGSPLLFATGHDGVIVHAYGESGGSKSSALLTAASFWGNPKKYVLNCNSKGATELYRTTRLGVLNNMPLCLDEITNIKEEMAKDFALGASQSGGRQTMKRDSTPRGSLTGDERSSIILSTANKSLQSLLSINNSAGVAAAMRVMDIRFDNDLRVHRPLEADTYLLGLFENYGWIGENFMRLVVAKSDKVRAAVTRKTNELAELGGQKSYERFWFSDAAASLVAGDIAAKLEYVVYDLRYMQDWFLREQLPELRGTIAEEMDATSPLAILMDYLARINGNILQTKKYPGMPKPNISDTFRGQLLAHHLIEQDIIHILKQDFRSYCQRIGRYSAEVLKKLAQIGVVTTIDRRVCLGEGTDLAKGRAWCFTVNLAHPSIASIMPKLVVQNSDLKTTKSSVGS